MKSRLGSPRTRLWMAAAVSALAALFVLVVNPFPSDVLGQTTQPSNTPATGSAAPGATTNVGGITVNNTSDQPVNIQVTGNTAIVAGPAGTVVSVAGATCTSVNGQSNVVSCVVTPGQTIVVSVAGVSRAPAPAAPAAAPAAPAAAPPVAPAPSAPQQSTAPIQRAPAPAAAPQQAVRPAALPSTGASVATGGGYSASWLLGVGLLAFAASLGSAAVVLSIRRARG